MAVACTMLTSVNSIAVAKKHSMKEKIDAMTQLLEYTETYPDAEITYYLSDIILHIHSDASYLSEPEAKIRFGGYFFLSSSQKDKKGNIKNEPLRNGAIHVISKLLRNILASAAEL